jgi:hypothetical protein
MAEDSNHLLGMDRVTAVEWAALLAMTLIVEDPIDGPADLDDDSRAVVATALQYNLTLLEEPQPYHGTLSGRLRVQTY